MRHLPVCIFLLFTGLLPAQTRDAARAYKNISWAGIVEQDFIVDAPCYEGEYLNEQQTLKFIHPLEEADIWEGNYLAGVLFEAIQNGGLIIYRDPDCRTPVAFTEAFASGDTVVSFDPDTYEERLFFNILKMPDPETIERWRVRGELYFNAKNAAWNLRNIAVAPLVARYDPATGAEIQQPAFWFKVARERKRINAKRFTWVKYLVPRAPGSLIDPESIEPSFTRAPNESPWSELLKACNDRPEIPLYSGTRFGGETLLTLAERRALLSLSDTIVVFDPLNYEETVKVVETRISPEFITALRLIHIWYWDARRKQLYIDIQTTAPMLTVTDNKGRFRYFRPLFYRRNP